MRASNTLCNRRTYIDDGKLWAAVFVFLLGDRVRHLQIEASGQENDASRCADDLQQDDRWVVFLSRSSWFRKVNLHDIRHISIIKQAELPSVREDQPWEIRAWIALAPFSCKVFTARERVAPVSIISSTKIATYYLRNENANRLLYSNCDVPCPVHHQPKSPSVPVHFPASHLVSGGWEQTQLQACRRWLSLYILRDSNRIRDIQV